MRGRKDEANSIMDPEKKAISETQSEDEDVEEESSEDEEMKIVEVEVETTPMDDFQNDMEQRDLCPRPNPSVISVPADLPSSLTITTLGGRILHVEDEEKPAVFPNKIPKDFLVSIVKRSAVPQPLGEHQDKVSKVMEVETLGAKRKIGQSQSLLKKPPDSLQSKRERPSKRISKELVADEPVVSFPQSPLDAKLHGSFQEKLKNANFANKNKASPSLDEEESSSPKNDGFVPSRMQTEENVTTNDTTATSLKSILPTTPLPPEAVAASIDPDRSQTKSKTSGKSGKKTDSYCSAPTCLNTRSRCPGKPFYR